MGNVTKKELVVSISNETGMVQQEVLIVVQKLLDQMTESLAEGKTIELRNFGVFEVRLTKPRVGRNPNKPENNVMIPPRATVKFKAGKIMKQRVLMQTDALKSSPLA
ncbi:MAG: HU family DNA-binding protein [Chthoniobacterales bacterium]